MVHPMMPDARREGHRAGVAECAISATHNSLKSQRARNLKSPISNNRAVTSKLCIRPRPTALNNHTASNSRATLFSAHRTAGALPTAISWLGAFRTPAARACECLIIPGVRKPAQKPTLRRRQCGVQQLANRPNVIRNAKRHCWRPRQFEQASADPTTCNSNDRYPAILLIRASDNTDAPTPAATYRS